MTPEGPKPAVRGRVGHKKRAWETLNQIIQNVL